MKKFNLKITNQSKGFIFLVSFIIIFFIFVVIGKLCAQEITYKEKYENGFVELKEIRERLGQNENDVLLMKFETLELSYKASHDRTSRENYVLFEEGNLSDESWEEVKQQESQKQDSILSKCRALDTIKIRRTK